jgi:hypothetical protein
MNRDELGRYIGVTGLSLGQVEKDYLQHIVLGGISRSAAGILVFKGGTALQKTGMVRRFSEDLDFTARNGAELKRISKAAQGPLGYYNFPSEIDSLAEGETAAAFRLRVRGPLYRDGRGLCTIRIEISRRENVLLPPDKRELEPPYSDILPYTLDVMQNREILAEKLRALSTRQKARDLYDAYMLITKGEKPDIELADRKMEFYGRRLDVPLLRKNLELLGPGWQRELERLLNDVPPFSVVLSAVGQALARAWV